MAEVVVYSSPWCPYCSRAKKLLNEKGVQFEEIDVMMQPRKRVEMTEKAEGRTTLNAEEWAAVAGPAAASRDRLAAALGEKPEA